TNLQRSNAHVPPRLRAALGPARSVTSKPNVVLVQGLGLTGQPAGATTLFRTDPTRLEVASLSLPPSVGINGKTLAATLDHGPTSGILAALGVAGLRVDHVALVSLAHLTDMVDALGGVTITNPAP